MSARENLLLAASSVALMLPAARAAEPNCSGVDKWATMSSFAHLKNAQITDNAKLDFAKTRTTLVASQKIGQDLYRQVHQIEFFEKTGNKIEVIAVNDASSEECSMSGVQVFVVARQLGGR